MQPSRQDKALYLIVCALLSIIIALVAGVISHSTGATLPQAVLYAGGAFVTAMALCVAVLSLLLL